MHEPSSLLGRRSNGLAPNLVLGTPHAGDRRLRRVRCVCRRCGAHVLALGLHVLSGECGNCRSYDLTPID
jgi:ribosomal protein L37E